MGLSDHISVCVATLHRNQMLERLLRKISLQDTEDLFEFSVVVVDNDSGGPARELVESSKGELGLDVIYAVEPDRCISCARNHALRLARGNYMAIIDDDEFPPPNWLSTMYRGIRTFDVDGSLGPVRPFFEEQPPSWLLRSGLCERPSPATGTLLHWTQTRTGNVLLKRAVFDKGGLRFDPTFRSGGSDREFFRRAMAAGFRFVSVAEAPVYEIVPPERWTRAYYLRRALVNGFNGYKLHRQGARGAARFLRMARSAGAVLVYGLATPLCACLGGHVLMRCLERGVNHLSQLLSMIGIEAVKNRQL